MQFRLINIVYNIGYISVFIFLYFYKDRIQLKNTILIFNLRNWCKSKAPRKKISSDSATDNSALKFKKITAIKVMVLPMNHDVYMYIYMTCIFRIPAEFHLHSVD